MDTEPASGQRGRWPWVQAHRGAARGLLQGVVILVGALGIWLIGIDPQRNAPIPPPPAAVPALPAPAFPVEPGLREGRPESALQPATVALLREPPVLWGIPDRTAASCMAPDVSLFVGAASSGGLSSPAKAVAANEALQPVGLRVVGLQPIDLPVVDRQADRQAEDRQLADSQPVDRQPVDRQPVDRQPVDRQPVDAHPAHAQVASADSQTVWAGGGALPLELLDGAASGKPEAAVDGILPGVFTSLLPAPTPHPPSPVVPETSNPWVWPVRGELSQGYSDGHRAIDISTEQGEIVVAADAGTVVYARWESTGYGYLVIIDHHNGFVSYYAHLYGFYIDVGNDVARGEQIGELGTTGRSTGPHLHFEIRQDGVQRNPLDLLP